MRHFSEYHAVLNSLADQDCLTRDESAWLHSFLTKLRSLISNGNVRSTFAQMLNELFKTASIEGKELPAITVLVGDQGQTALLKQLNLLRHELDLLCGGLSFFAGCIHISKKNFDAARQYFSAFTVHEFIRLHYSIEEHEVSSKDFSTLTPYARGATSLIFRCGTQGEHVLKLLQPRYLEQPEIGGRLERYGSQFSGATGQACQGITPIVSSCGYGWVKMEYIDGKTLQQFIKEDVAQELSLFRSKRLATSGSRAARMKYFRTMELVFSAILLALKQVASNEMAHLNLSPSNIIVKTSSDSLEVKLIDFGPNSQVAARIGHSQDIEELHTYLSPELRAGVEAGVVSDIYSLGVLLLEYWVGSRIKTEELDQSLDEVWMECPDLATIIDDCLTTQPRFRALEYKVRAEIGVDVPVTGRAAERLYDLLLSRFTTAANKAQHGGHSQLLGLVLNYQVVDQLFRLVVFSGDYVFEKRETEITKRAWRVRELKLNVFRYVCWFAVTVCIVWMPLGIVFSDFDQSLAAVKLRELLSLSYVEHDKAWPGRVICVSFAIVAGTYYLNIFQSIDIYGDRVTAAVRIWPYRVARWTLRFNSWCFAMPILFALVVYPTAWPYCSGVGLVFVGINNLFMHRAGKRALSAMDKSLRVRDSQSVRDDMTEFRGWDLVIFAYAAGLGGVGYVLMHVLNRESNDPFIVECIVAGLALLVNHVKMHGGNCIKRAPRVRKMFLRIFLSQRRMLYGDWQKLIEAIFGLSTVKGWLRDVNTDRLSVDVHLAMNEWSSLKQYIREWERSGAVVNWQSIPSDENKDWSIRITLEARNNVS